MKLPEVAVKEMRYWAVFLYDEFRPNGEEWPDPYPTEEAAKARAQRFIDKKLATPKETA